MHRSGAAFLLATLAAVVIAGCSMRPGEMSATTVPSSTAGPPEPTLATGVANPLADISVPEQNIRIVTRWDAPQRVRWDPRNTLSDTGASDPQAAATPDGTVHVVWAQQTTDGARTSSIMYRRLTNGLWSDSETIRPNAHAPRLAADGIGQLHLLWAETQPCEVNIYGCPVRIFYSLLPKGGTWTSPQELTNLLHLTDAPEAMAAAGDGTLHIAWSEKPHGHIPADSVWYAQRRSDGNWLSPEQAFRPTGSPQLVGGIASAPRPSIAVDDDGTTFMAWGDNATSSATTYFAVRSQGGEWSKPKVLFRFQKGISAPLLTPIGDGFLALLLQTTWFEDQLFPGGQRGGRESMFVIMVRSPDGAWSVPETTPNMDGDASWPAVVADTAGRLFTVWSYAPPSAIGAFSALRLPDPPRWSIANSLPVLPDEQIFDKKLLMRGDGQLLLVAAAAAAGYDHRKVVAFAGCLFPERLPTPPTPGATPTPTPVPERGATPTPRPTPTPVPTCLPMTVSQ